MRRKILLILGISVLSFVVFVLASFYLLPSDKLRHLAEKTIENKLKQAQAVEIEDISISPLLNITAKNFRMTPRVTEPPQAVFATEGGIIDGFYCAPTVEDIPFVIDRIFVNPAVFSTIKKNPAGTFELEMKDGKVSGELKSKSKAMELTAKGENISLNEFALLSNYIKMQIYGNLGFDLRAIIFRN